MPAGPLGAALPQKAPAPEPTAGGAVGSSSSSDLSVRITSPVGRIGTPGTIRIVAQVRTGPTATIQPLRFFVDGVLVGTAETGPPYAVPWVDDNPFLRHEIVVQAYDSEIQLRNLVGRLEIARRGDPELEVTLADRPGYVMHRSFCTGLAYGIPGDRGNGACEVVYVTEFEVLREANTAWRTLHKLSLALVVLSLAALILL